MEDKSWINEILRQEQSQSADHCFANIFVWDDTYKQEVANLYGCLGIRLSYTETPFYAFPVGHGDTRKAIGALQADSKLYGQPLQLRGILQNQLAWLNDGYPNAFIVNEDRFAFDYIYSASKLSSLSGKKLQPKRNYINRFILNHPDWRYEPLLEKSIPACVEFQKHWLETHTNDNSNEYAAENMALERCFKHYNDLPFEGGILYADDKVIGYTIGEKLTCDTFDVHFEKADSSIPGAYAVINREFVRQVIAGHPEIRFINREDDMGLESLRKSKLSYAPEALIKKHTATWRGS